MSYSSGYVDLSCDSISEIRPVGGYSAATELSLELSMSKKQMRAALENFLEHITDAEWADWVRELAADVIADERQQAASDALEGDWHDRP